MFVLCTCCNNYIKLRDDCCSNQLIYFKVMLVSDPTTDKSAGALDVHIGYMVDDQDLPGLAHFCEHMRKGVAVYLCFFLIF